MNNFYVYVHFRKDNLQPFYVGKGKDNRFKAKSGRSEYWKRTVAKYGLFPQIMENNLTEEQAFEREKFYIEVLGRKNLCNHTDGGEGVSGLKHSELTKNKLKDIKKDFKHSEDVKKQMSNTRKILISKNIGFGFIKPKKIINIETQEIFECIKVAAESFGIKRQTLNAYLSGQNKNKTPFEYYQQP